MKKFFLNKRFLYFVTIPLLFFFTGLEAGDRVLYETRFQRTEDMALWTAEGEGALIDYVSRITGNSLKITTRIGDGKKTLWAGPPIKIGGDKNIRLTGWWANNLIWAQDHLYCGVVAATFYDSHGREIKRLPIAYLSMPKKPIRYVNEWFVPDGLFWEFFEGTVEVPPGAVSVKPVFAFSHYLEPWRDILLEGDIWIDDIRIASVDRTEEIFSETEGDVFLGVHTPVEINLFVPSDRVAFNIAIPAESLPEEVDWKKMSLLYEVLNIDRLVLLRGRIPFRETPDRYDKNLKPGGGDAGYWIRLAPDEKIKEFQGQWLAIKVTLTDGKKEYVSGDTGFAILSPRQVTLQQVWNERILCGNVAGKYRDIDPSDFYFGYKRTPPFGDAKRPSWSEIIGRTGLLNLYLFSKETWEKAQPSADSPLDFSSFPDNPAKPIYGRPDPTANRVIPWEERVPSYRFFFHLQGGEKAMPDWVITRDANGNPVTRRKGDKFVYEIDEDAFAEWVLEAVKHTDSTHYVVTSLEGPGYQDYPELVLKSARAIKRWDSRIKVGACGMTGKEGAQKLKELGLLKYLDFLVNDIYSTVVEERAFIEEVHRYNPDFEYILTEYHHMTGRGHFSLARNTIRFITTALGSGVSKIHWMGSPILKNMVGANLIHRWGPDLWSPYETSGNAAFLALTRTTGEGPRLNLPENASSISNIPMLELIAHYHISRLLGSSTGGEEIAGFNKKCKTYRFLRTPETVIVSWTRQGEPAFDALLSSDSTSLEITDITGRVKTLQPFHGKAFITLSEDPLFFHLQKTGRVGTEEAYVQISGLDRPFTRMQGKGRKININLKNSFGSPVKVKIIPSIDIRWKITPLSVEKLLKTGETDRFTFEIEPSEIVPPGRYPFFVEIYAENHLTGWITRSIEVQNNISIQVDSRPASGRVRPAVIARLSNNKPVRTTGKVFYTNLITPEMEPVNMEKEYSIPPYSTEEVIFPLDGNPSTARRYDVKVKIKDNDGTEVEKEEYAFFIGSYETRQPIKVDGDLSDWELSEIPAYPFFFHVNYSRDKNEHLWKDRGDCDGVFYTRWDDERLYLGFRIWKKVFYNDGEFSGVWPYDCMHVSLYPYPLKKGESLVSVPYRDHIAIDKHGRAIIDRCQAPYPIPPYGGYWPEGSEVAIIQHKDHYVFEISYSRKSVEPLHLTAGSRFCLGLSFLYSNQPDIKKGFAGIGWFYGTGNVDGAPDMHGEIQLIGGKND